MIGVSHKARIHNMIGMSHETQIHNIAIENVIIIIGMSHQIQIHNIALESVIIMINVFLGKKKFNEKAPSRFLWYI